MKTIDYMNQVKRRLEIESNYALAKALGITQQAVGAMMSGKTTMGDATALKVADILKIQRALVLADVHAEREKNPELAAVWRSLVDKLALGFDVLMSCTTPRKCLGARVAA